MRVRYLSDFDFTPPNERRQTFAKRKGNEETVKHDWAEAMITEGLAEEVPVPARKADDAGSR